MTAKPTVILPTNHLPHSLVDYPLHLSTVSLVPLPSYLTSQVPATLNHAAFLSPTWNTNPSACFFFQLGTSKHERRTGLVVYMVFGSNFCWFDRGPFWIRCHGFVGGGGKGRGFSQADHCSSFDRLQKTTLVSFFPAMQPALAAWLAAHLGRSGSIRRIGKLAREAKQERRQIWWLACSEHRHVHTKTHQPMSWRSAAIRPRRLNL